MPTIKELQQRQFKRLEAGLPHGVHVKAQAPSARLTDPLDDPATKGDVQALKDEIKMLRVELHDIQYKRSLLITDEHWRLYNQLLTGVIHGS